MKDLIVIGASGFGREIAWLVERINETDPTWNIVGYLDDNDAIVGNMINNYRVLGRTDLIKDYPEAYVVCAIGAASTRRKVISNLVSKNNKIKFATLIDPSVILSNSVSVGEGTVICAGSILTVNIDIGKHCIVNLGCTVGHDAIIRDYVTLYPGVNVSGKVMLEDCCEIGTGSAIIQGMKIVKNTIIGAGAIVNKSINKTGTYVGVPAILVP